MILLAKHAQHVVLIHFPIALFVIGAMFDLLSRGKRNSQLASAAYWRIECQCVPWLEHEILHRSEPDWTFARTRPRSVHSYFNVSCLEWAPLPSQRGFDFCTTSVGQARQGGAMAIGKSRRRTVESPMIHRRTRSELTDIPNINEVFS